MIKCLLINPFVLFYKKYFHLFTLYQCSSFRVKTNWNNADNRNLLFKLKSKLGLYHVVVTTPKLLPKNLH